MATIITIIQKIIFRALDLVATFGKFWKKYFH